MVSIQVGAVCPLDAWRSRPRGRRCPPLPLGVLPPMAAALLRYARGGQHSRPPHRLSACSAARPARVGGQITRGGAEKPARPSRRLRCAPPVRPRLPSSCSSGGGRPLREAPAIGILSSGGGWFLRGHSAAALPFAGRAVACQGRGGLLALRAAEAAAAPPPPPPH